MIINHFPLIMESKILIMKFEIDNSSKINDMSYFFHPQVLRNHNGG